MEEREKVESTREGREGKREIRSVRRREREGLVIRGAIFCWDCSGCCDCGCGCCCCWYSFGRGRKGLPSTTRDDREATNSPISPPSIPLPPSPQMIAFTTFEIPVKTLLCSAPTPPPSPPSPTTPCPSGVTIAAHK